jgi:hypothetical protein
MVGKVASEAARGSGAQTRREGEMDHRVANSRVLIAVIIVGSVFLLTAGAAVAAGSTGEAMAPAGRMNGALTGGSDLSATSAISHTEQVTGGQMIAGCLAAFFDVPMTDVVTLHSEGYGFGEVAIAYFLASDSGLTLEEILELREGDMGWGEIAQMLGLPPSNRDRNLGQLVSGRVVSGTVPVGAQRLAERLGATPEEVAELLDEGANYGTITVAYKLADKLEGVTPADLVEQRLAGLSWGEIKRAATTTTTTTSLSAESGQGKPEGTGRPDHAGPPEGKGPRDHGGPKGNNGHSK